MSTLDRLAHATTRAERRYYRRLLGNVPHPLLIEALTTRDRLQERYQQEWDTAFRREHRNYLSSP